MTSNRRPSAAHGPRGRGPGRRRRSSDASADRTFRPNPAAEQSRDSSREPEPAETVLITDAAYPTDVTDADTVATKPSKVTKTSEAKTADTPRPKSRWAEFLPTAGWTAAILGILVVLIAITTLLLSGAGYGTIPAAIGTTWMLAHLAPLVIDGTVLGMVPGLPAMGVVALVAVMVRRAVKKPVSIQDVGALAAGTIGVPLLITCAAWLMLWDASKVYAIEPPALWRALLTTALVHALGFLFGLGQTLWRGMSRHYGLPDELIDASRLAGRWLATLSAAGLLVLLVMLALRWGTVQQAFEIAPSAGGKVALMLLNILYLPNAIVASVSVLLGGDAFVGVASASLFALTPGTLPPMPLLAALPTGTLNPWFAALLVVPAALAVWVTLRHFRDGSDSPLIEVGGATVLAALGAALASATLGGELGLYGWSGTTWWLVGGLAGLWLSVIGTCVVMLAVWRGYFALVDDEAPVPADEAATSSPAAATAPAAAAAAAGEDDIDHDVDDDIIDDGEIVDEQYDDEDIEPDDETDDEEEDYAGEHVNEEE